ncbi:GAF domain-containing sensor histidine kinase [Nostoc sp. MS1]|uniref:GAF domain-containing sensor histidine kinase n=1 Tax=Nostoc sp. MS1 TaxID=2764711 RepID=UPI001CC3BB8F|nr:GAF domain-containing sensor histidine kinase [Nostoc sp. MS1]BCL37958.1 hypothetical protein NSMS1_44050 [Nostoc sp. MS1]
MSQPLIASLFARIAMLEQENNGLKLQIAHLQQSEANIQTHQLIAPVAKMYDYEKTEDLVRLIPNGFHEPIWLETQAPELELTQAIALLQTQVAELAKTNQTLKNSFARLAANPNLNSFLGYVLLEITQQLNLDFASLRLYDSTTQTLPIEIEIVQGQINLKHQIQAPEAYLRPSTLSTPVWNILLQTKQPVVVNHENAPAYCFQNTYEYQAHQLNLQIAANLLLTLGDEPIGMLALASTQPHNFTPEKLKLAQALAQHATLAIQLTRLADEAKQTALLEERNRMASEIHDTLAQTFIGISIQVGMAQRLVTTNPSDTQQILERVLKLAQTGLAEARRSVWELHPTADEYTDLVHNLQTCIDHLTNGLPMQVELQISGTPCLVPAIIGQNLLRIAQEAINNTISHTQATQLWVRLNWQLNMLELSIQDNGDGFDPKSENGGFGLVSMSERASRLNGHFTLCSQPSYGTEIRVKVPIK